MQKPKLYKCYGKKCVENGTKHELLGMKQFKESPKRNFCCECYTITEDNKRQRKMLESFLFHVFEEPVNKMVRAQIKRLEDDDYTLKNIRLTLEYFLNVRDEKLIKSKGIAIVPYVHDEMIAYHKDRLRKASEVQIIDRGVKKITMKYPSKKFDYKQEKTINLEELANAIKK